MKTEFRLICLLTIILFKYQTFIFGLLRIIVPFMFFIRFYTVNYFIPVVLFIFIEIYIYGKFFTIVCTICVTNRQWALFNRSFYYRSPYIYPYKSFIFILVLIFFFYIIINYIIFQMFTEFLGGITVNKMSLFFIFGSYLVAHTVVFSTLGVYFL